MEVRFPDPTANPYLAFRGAVDGGSSTVFRTRSTPVTPRTRIFTTCQQRKPRISQRLASSLEMALDALAADRELPDRGWCVHDDMIDGYINLKMAEVERLNSTPHPVEFEMYYSV